MFVVSVSFIDIDLRKVTSGSINHPYVLDVLFLDGGEFSGAGALLPLVVRRVFFEAARECRRLLRFLGRPLVHLFGFTERTASV